MSPLPDARAANSWFHGVVVLSVGRSAEWNLAMGGYAKELLTKIVLGIPGPSETGVPAGYPHPCPDTRGVPHLRGGSRPLAGNPSAITRKDWTDARRKDSNIRDDDFRTRIMDQRRGKLSPQPLKAT